MEEKINAAVSVDLGDNLTNLIEQLAIQIGTTADKIFPWYVQQQVIEGWTKAGIFAFLIGASTLTVIISMTKADYDSGNVPAFLSLIFGGIALLAILIVSKP